MPLVAVLLPILAAAADTSSTPVVVRGYAWAPFISPMGEPFRYRTRGDDTLAKWFNQADADRDGALTLQEMQGDADRFFAKLDTNKDGQIDPDEIVQYEWEVAPEIQVMSKRRRGRDEPRTLVEAKPTDSSEVDGDEWIPAIVGDGLERGLQGAARYSLLNIPQPVAAADADFDRLVSSVEFRQAAIIRFSLIDKGQQGRVTLDQLRAMLPVYPSAPTTSGATDTRYGNPLPPRN